MKKWFFAGLGLLPILSSIPIYSITIGSDIAVNRFNNQQSLNTGDIIAGFAAMQGGIRLTSSSVTATFNSFFPVSGPIDLAGGTLVLLRDLVITDTYTIIRWGNIIGNNHRVVFGASEPVMPSIVTNSCYTISNVNFYLNSNVSFHDTCWIFSGTCGFYGQNYILSLGSTVTFLIDIGSQCTLDSITLQGIDTEKISGKNSSSILNLQDTVLVLDGNYSFTVGSFVVRDNCYINGNNYIFVLGTDQVCTITNNSTLYIGEGMTFSYSPRTNNQSLLNFIDSTSRLFLNGATLYSTVTGINIMIGTVEVDGSSVISADGQNATTGILLGDGTPQHNMQLIIDPAAVLTINN